MLVLLLLLLLPVSSLAGRRSLTRPAARLHPSSLYFALALLQIELLVAIPTETCDEKIIMRISVRGYDPKRFEVRASKAEQRMLCTVYRANE